MARSATRSARDFERLPAVAVLLAVVLAVFLLCGAVADAGLIRGNGDDTGAAVVPHGSEAYIYDLFGLSTNDRRTLGEISDDLVSEGYHVNLLRDDTEGTGSPGRATIENFVKMADDASVIVINTHGTDFDFSHRPESCLSSGKGIERTPPSNDIEVCVPANQEPVLQVAWYRTYEDEQREYDRLVHGLHWDTSWLYEPPENLQAPRSVGEAPKGIARVEGAAARPWLGLTTSGIEHFFNGHHIDLVDNLACHSMLFASQFGALSYFGHAIRACTQFEEVDEPRLWDRLTGGSGIAARRTTTAYIRGGFVDPNFQLWKTSPVVLSPAVEHVAPEDGSEVTPGTKAEGGVFFDAKMDTGSANGVVTASGCGATLANASWESPTHLAFELSVPKNTVGSEVTLTVHTDRARGGDGSSRNQWLDGNRDPAASGAAPNRDDYVWHVACPNGTYPIKVSYTGTFNDAYSVPADRQIYTHKPFFSNTTFSFTESRVITVRFNGSAMTTDDGKPSVTVTGTSTTLNQSGGPEVNCKWRPAPGAGSSIIVNSHDPSTERTIHLQAPVPAIVGSGVCSDQYPAPWDFWHPDSSDTYDPGAHLQAMNADVIEHLDLDLLRKAAYSQSYKVGFTEHDRGGGTDRVSARGTVSISLAGAAASSGPAKPAKPTPNAGGSGNSNGSSGSGTSTGATTSETKPFDFPGPGLDNLGRTTTQLGGGGDQTVPVEDEHWPDPGTLLDEICIVPDPKNPTGPCPSADDLASGSLAVAPAPSAASSGTLSLSLTARGKAVLAAGKPIVVLLRVTFSPKGGKALTATRSMTLTPPAAAAPAAPRITSVTFGGTQLAPLITIHGTDLGTRPAPDPSYTPSNQPWCPVKITGTPGYDYGTKLYIEIPVKSLAAGRYRPEIMELDCLGLIVTKFTPTEVDLRIGGFYKQAYPKYAIVDGDSANVVVNGATIFVHVKYGSTVTN